MTCAPVLVEPSPEILLADPETEATIDVIEAYRLVAEEQGHQLLAAGWTAHLLFRLDCLGRHAAAAQTGFFRRAWDETGAEPDGTMLTQRLLHLASLIALGGQMPLAEVLDWLTVAVASPEPGAVYEFANLRAIAAEEPGRPEDRETLLLAWRRALPRELAPWAWALGMTPRQAASVWTMTGLDRATLIELVERAGFRLPW